MYRIFLFPLLASYGWAQVQTENQANPSDEALISIGKATMTKFQDKLNDPWQFVQTDEVTGIEIYELRHANGSTASIMAKLKSPYPPEVFFTEFYVKVGKIPNWSPIVTNSVKLKQIDPRTRIVFQNLRAQATLPLADRTFLIVQRTEVQFIPNQGLSYRAAYTGIDYKSPLIPKLGPGVRRADVGISGFVIKPDPSNPGGTEFTWISTVQFKYPEVPKEVSTLFERFNLVLYVEALGEHVKDVMSKRQKKSAKANRITRKSQA